MLRLSRLAALGALTAVVIAGCGAGSHQTTVTKPSGNFPIVVAHPSVQTSGLPSDLRPRLGIHRAALLSRSQIAFLTSGTVSCVWLPARLTVLGPSAIRIDMRVNGSVSSCGSGAVGFPIAVKIPRAVDVTAPVTVRLAYKVRLPGGGTNRWNHMSVAPALHP